MAGSESKTAADAQQVIADRSGRPRIVFLHFTAPPVVGGVEAVIAEQMRLFSAAGYPTLMIAGRAAEHNPNEAGPTAIIREMDSEHPAYLQIQPALEAGKVPAEFKELQASIETSLRRELRPGDIVLAHNILTTHFNLALTGAVHQMVRAGHVQHLIIWCHDLSRHVNPERPAPQYHGMPWDLLRTPIESATYVAVSSARRRSLANILGLPADRIRVIPNGVDPTELLGLSAMGKKIIHEFDLFSADLILLMPVRVTKVKNIEFAMEIVRALKDAGQTVRLIITGPPDPHVTDISQYYEGLIDQRDQIGLQDEIVFLHEGMPGRPAPLSLEASEIGELYRIADAVLMPSIREGFGMPVLEAAMVDRPVFATSIPVVQDLPGFQFLIESGESAASVASRMMAWSESDAAHVLRKRVRSSLTWSKIFSRELLPLINSVIQSHHRSHP